MYYERAKYEALISSSCLFKLDRETEKTAYKREAYKMVEYLYCYLLSINEHDYEPYGCEIMEVATRCIANYDPKKGVFLYYFISAWKQEYSHIKGEKISDDRFRGMKVTEEDKRAIRKYIKLAEKFETSESQEVLYKRIAEALNIPIEKVALIARMSNCFVTSGSVNREDGENINLWDQVADEIDIEAQFEMADSIEDLLQKISRTYAKLQDRQKPIISDMMTIRIWPVIAGDYETDSFAFLSQDVIREYSMTGEMPSQRQIAERYHRNEASISRSVKEFLSKLRQEMSEG